MFDRSAKANQKLTAPDTETYQERDTVRSDTSPSNKSPTQNFTEHSRRTLDRQNSGDNLANDELSNNEWIHTGSGLVLFDVVIYPLP